MLFTRQNDDDENDNEGRRINDENDEDWNRNDRKLSTGAIVGIVRHTLPIVLTSTL